MGAVAIELVSEFDRDRVAGERRGRLPERLNGHDDVQEHGGHSKR
jgi:hypothetical protein